MFIVMKFGGTSVGSVASIVIVGESEDLNFSLVDFA